MDPFSIGASSIALLATAMSIFKYAGRIKMLWTEAPWEIDAAQHRAEVLRGTLVPFRDEKRRSLIPAETQKQLRTAMIHCKVVLRQIRFILQQVLRNNPSKGVLVMRWGLENRQKVENLGKQLDQHLTTIGRVLGRANL
jgi:hypothetical protein